MGHNTTDVDDKPKRADKAARKQVVDEIVNEAETRELPDEHSKSGDLEARVRESEQKRLLLAEALHSSRMELRRLMPGAEGEGEKALPYGVFVKPGKERGTVVIRHHGRLYEARILTEESEEPATPKKGTFHAIRQATEKKLTAAQFRKGEWLLLNNDLQVMASRGFDLICGALATVEQVLSEDKLLVKTVGEECIVVNRAEPLASCTILEGDKIECDAESLFAYRLLPRSDVDRLALEKVPDISYADVGGLDEAVQLIRDSIELPHLYPEYFKEHKLVPPKGILLYGPPGCGKTLLAKAVANSLATRIREETGQAGQSFFLNVKGPELLNKYVGESERAIRDLFARARAQSSERTPVIIFFDEMDSMFRIRGSGISSDMEATIVPQFLAELDGLEALENVVIIGATNREDLIDPAILRPGRLDRKIRVPRPDRNAALDIFSKYLTPDLPLDVSRQGGLGTAADVAQWMINQVVEEMFSLKEDNELIEVTYADGTRTVLYFKDFASGAIMEHIVTRAKLAAVKDLIAKGERGIRVEHLLRALREEYEENEELPSNTNPNEWYRIIGKGGERVVRVRSLFRKDRGKHSSEKKPEEVVSLGAGLKAGKPTIETDSQ
ncbi:MAG: proteasome ATPase [Thermodesulfobacteriota bacterium]